MNKYIDHTLLRQGATYDDLHKLCNEAIEYNFAAVCVAPYYVIQAKHLLEETNVKVCTVIGFPFGYSSLDTKFSEIEIAIVDGADEIDIVQNVSLVKDEEWEELDDEMAECVGWAKICAEENNVKIPVIKVILETGILTNEEIVECCKIYSNNNRIDFIKTSTGFAKEPLSGVEFEENKINVIKLIKENIPSNIQIKASGGIRNGLFAEKLIEAGATRLGCSDSVKITQQCMFVDEHIFPTEEDQILGY